MMCRANLNDEFDECRGLTLFNEKHSVVLEDDLKCHCGIFRVIYRKRKTFDDGSGLNYDTLMFCADEKVLKEISNSIINKFGE